ncbi:MAG: ATP-grasp domain-containing protein [Patescibacteria group bacterium]|nr:ATP-grasp domain-containing protein [Patescibacteria group bacterium]
MIIKRKNLKIAGIKNNSPVFFITPNPNRAIGLEKIIKNYQVICSQKSDAVEYFKKNKVSVLCLNDDNIKNSGKILLNKKTIKYIKEKSKNKKANIISFKPSPMIQKICAENNFNYLGNDWKLNRRLEDKIKFAEITKKLKIPNAGSKIIKLEKSGYSIKFSKNKKFIIQLPRGFSGNSTFLVRNKNDFNKIFKKYENRKVKLSKYIKGETYTINACVAGNKILVSKPIFQITGLSSYNKNSFGTCGNDYVYPEKLKKEERKKIFDCVKKIGNYLKKTGYQGIFGLDFIVSDNDVNLIEINPRLIASIPVFTKLQIQNKQSPFLLLHILEFLTLPSSLLSGEKKKINFEKWDFKKWNKENNFNASQLILRNVKNRSVKIKKSLVSGIYEIKDDKLILKKETYGSNKNLKDKELLIQCAMENSVINPDMEYANIQVGYGIMENERDFKDCFKKIIKLVMKNIKY